MGLEDKDIQNAAVKIQAAFKGFKVRSVNKSKAEPKHVTYDSSETESDREDLPNLDDKDVQDAALKIQAVFKGFQVRKKKDEIGQKINSSTDSDSSATESEQEDLPDLEDKEVQEAAIKIQSAFKGFKVRSKKKADTIKDEDLPDLSDKNVKDAAVKIQAAFKGFKVRKENKENSELNKRGSESSETESEDNDLPDLNDKEVADAAVKIQAAFKGFKVRKAGNEREKVRKSTPDSSETESEQEDLPDLNDNEVLEAAIKIQSAFKGFKVRNQMKDTPGIQKDIDSKKIRKKKIVRAMSSSDSSETESEGLPDLEDKDVQDAAAKIQAAFKGFKVRSKFKEDKADSLPDLQDADVKKAAVMIQKTFKGYKVRSQFKEKEAESLPDLHDQDVKKAAVMIQKTFKGFKVRSKYKEKEAESLPDLHDADVKKAAVMIQKTFKGYKVRNHLLYQIFKARDSCLSW